MAQTPEGKIKDMIKKWCKANDVFYTMPVTGGYGSSGVPDFLLCVQGLFIGIEAKAPGKGRTGVTALQKACMARISKAGGLCFVVDSRLDLEAIEAGLRMRGIL